MSERPPPGFAEFGEGMTGPIWWERHEPGKALCEPHRCECWPTWLGLPRCRQVATAEDLFCDDCRKMCAP